MSADEPLSKRDRAVLEQSSNPANGEVRQAEQLDDALEDRVDQLEDTVSKLVDALGETKADLEEERAQKKELAKKINQLQDQVEGGDELVGSNTLEKFSTRTTEEREELLTSSQKRAVSIYEHWDELSWQTGGRDNTHYLLETQARANAKNQPSKIKYRLENHFGEDLAWNEIYRAMKAVAKLSGGEESTDADGRLHIEGGDFEYHVLPTADNTKTRRVLKRVDE